MKRLSVDAIYILLLLVFSLVSLNSCSSPGTPVLQIYTLSNAGSGFVVAETKDSWIVATAAHCTQEDEVEIQVDPNAPDAMTFIFKTKQCNYVIVEGELGKVIAVHKTFDVALIKVPKRERVFKIWKLTNAVQGESVILYGWRWEAKQEPIKLEWRGWIVSTNWNGYIVTNSGSWWGCSGGPMVDWLGGVVGVTCRFEVIHGQVMEHVVLAVPSSVVKELLDEVAVSR